MTDDEYCNRRAHLRSINVYTADCPPDDELAALEERYIEQITEEKMENLYESPERIQEYILESDYENTRMLHACSSLGRAIQSRSATCADITLKLFNTFFENAVKKEATDYVGDL